MKTVRHFPTIFQSDGLRVNFGMSHLLHREIPPNSPYYRIEIAIFQLPEVEKMSRMDSRRSLFPIVALSLGIILSPLPAFAQQQVTIIEPPGVDSRPNHLGNELTLINGRKVTPAGKFVRTQSYSWGMAISPDEQLAVLMRSGAIEFVSLADRNPVVLDRIPPYGEKLPPEFQKGTYMGCLFSPDGTRLYLSDANRGAVHVMDVASRKFIDNISIDDEQFKESFVGDMALTPDGKSLVVVDQFNFRMAKINLQDKTHTSTRVGRHPFGVRISPDGKHAWVSNVGMFEYPVIPGITSREFIEKEGLDFPAYGIPSKEAEEGVVVNGKRIPGLGSPNHPDAMSVFKVNLESMEVESRIKTGYLVGKKRNNITTVGGASPSTVAIGSRLVYVANTTNDTISIIDPNQGTHLGQIELLVPRLETLRGVMPFGITLSPDELTLYVACAGLNAVAVIDLTSNQVQGYIPAGWFASFVRCSQDGNYLFISSVKGVGSGPNGGKDFVAPKRGLHPGDIMQGTIQVVPVPETASLQRMTEQVVANTFVEREILDDPRHPLPPRSGIRHSPIKHVVFICKENRTFDQIYGKRQNVTGDPTLASLSMDVTLTNKAGETLEHANVSPNHQRLADQFAMSDNFYCDSDQSNTGHRWIAGVYPNEWVEVNARSHIESNIFSSAPGRRNVNGSSAVVNPEDYNEAGALWEHLDRNGVSFFNFGFGTEMPQAIEEQIHKYTGVKMSVSFPLPKPLFDNTSRRFATYNTSIPDQFRVDMFEQDMAEKWESGKEPFPSLITMVLPNDHMSGERPEAGYPYRESYVADNDVALGRVVQKLSHSKWWPEMLIIVVEDDSQGGPDHAEAHRSLFLLISPHVKKNYVSHRLLNFGSAIKLIFTILDMPYLNQFDATAGLPRDMFTLNPDFAPYDLVQSDLRLFDPAKALKPFDRGFDWKALLKSPKMDNLADMRRGFAPNDDNEEEEEEDEDE